MSIHFLDTSGLVKHYHTEVGTAKREDAMSCRLKSERTS